MKNRTRLAAIVTTASGITMLAGAASAGTIDHTDLPNGSNLVNLSRDGVDITVSAPVRDFKHKTVNGWTGVGISGGAVDGEIDGRDESILFNFSEPVAIDTIEVAFLYTDGNFGDVGDEAAKFITDIGEFTLTANTATSGTWTGPSGIASNISIATVDGGGVWLIQATLRSVNGIFNAPITSLELKSAIPGSMGKYSDFAFVSTSFVRDVPTPGALACAGIAGLLAVPRRRRSR